MIIFIDQQPFLPYNLITYRGDRGLRYWNIMG